MCGIVGILDFSSPPTQSDIVKMRDLISYRGPDDCGIKILTSDGVALGHRRLSIIDPRPSGKQPMCNSDNSLHIVFNGEIYNYLEIKKELETAQYNFKTSTDTEVLLYAYDYWGTDCLNRLIGMFAFAIWDCKRKVLFAARDRIGIKPFYYSFNGARFLFASEVKCIVSLQKDKSSINLQLIDSYMSFGYIPGENTLNKWIKRLLPGHYLIYSKDEFKVSKYWDFTFSQDTDKGLDYYVDQLETLLNDAINLRLRSDVPLGVFLSGGLDSSSVVALLATRVAKRLKTFSVAYDFGPEYNETNYAKQVSDYFNTDHHELMLTSKEFKEFIPGYVQHMDEPVTESAAISLYYLSKLTKKHVTVVLSGEGADELFGGYDFYVYNLAIENYRRIFGTTFSKFIYGAASKFISSQKVHKYFILSTKSLVNRYKGISSYDEKFKDDLYHKEFRDYLTREENSNDSFISSIFENTANSDSLSRMLYFDTKTWLVDDLLIKADRMSMAASLELRVPFLDHRLVEFAATVPSKYKVRAGTTKYLLKKLMQSKLPIDIIKRKKMGFPTPLKIMFRNELSDYVSDTLLSKQAIERGYFKTNMIRRVLDEHLSGHVDHHRVLWQLLVLEEWHIRFA
ncbi:MAG: asparagine synthase (glutamine-hydrolyzing) [Candidatus Scalindua sp.]|nr:asparagine synthase (glutamine-hydrolyzing) [Candidatus Scalindua sp.]